MPGFYKDVISGRRAGVVGAACRMGLSALSAGYHVAISSRNFAWDRLRQPRQVPVPVVSVGNLTTGGTGKTPIVAWLANWGLANGLHTAIISRGYRSLAEGGNDEKRVLDRLCPDVPHMQNPDRIAAAQELLKSERLDLLLLDDGFQHRRIARDLDIVLIDALNPFGYDWLLPRGLLREPVSELRRAQIVLMTRSNLIAADAQERLKRRIGELTAATVLITTFEPESLVKYEGETRPLKEFCGQQVAGLCGIGNPGGFRATLRSIGFEIPDTLWFEFPDHHHFSAEDVNAVIERANQQGPAPAAFVCTEKDLVKLEEWPCTAPPLFAVRIGVQFPEGSDPLEVRLRKVTEQGVGERSAPAGLNSGPK